MPEVLRYTTRCLDTFKRTIYPPLKLRGYAIALEVQYHLAGCTYWEVVLEKRPIDA